MLSAGKKLIAGFRLIFIDHLHLDAVVVIGSVLVE